MYARAWLMLTLSVFVSVSASLLRAAEVNPGDGRDRVKQVLGEPKGELHKGDQTFLIYDRGSVELRNDQVVEASLISPAALAQIQAQRAKDDEARRRYDEDQRAQLQQEGLAEKMRVLADTAFPDSPPADQVAYWQHFQSQYPGTDVNEELAAARKKLDTAQEEARIRQLEEKQKALAQAEPEKKLSGSKQRKYDRIQKNKSQPLVMPAYP